MLRQNASAEGSFKEPSAPPAGSRAAPRAHHIHENQPSSSSSSSTLTLTSMAPRATPPVAIVAGTSDAAALSALALPPALTGGDVFDVARRLPRALADKTGCALAAVGAPLTPAAAPGVAGPPPPSLPLPPPLGLLEPESKPRLLTLTTSVLSGPDLSPRFAGAG